MSRLKAFPGTFTPFALRPSWLAVLFGLLVAALGVPSHAAPKSKTGLPPEIVSFIQAKEAHARALAKKLDLEVSPEVWDFIRAAQTRKASATTNAFNRLMKRAGQYEGSRAVPGVATPAWQIALEIELAVDACADGDPKYSMAFGRGVIESIPRGSIYFGGTDPGRGLPTALSKSHEQGDPIYTITQNALADGNYLAYIRATYGDKIRTPTEEDSQQTFREYLADAQKRLDHDRRFPREPRQIKPGEDVRIVNNRVQVSGQVAVMSINALLVRTIFEANPDCEFYIEESFPLEWMYPHLSPHGFIFKVNREPLTALSDETVRNDRAFWRGQQQELIGGWLTPETPVKDVCAFVRKTFGRKDLSSFKGDRRFVQNAYAGKLYAKLRSASGGLYAWRAGSAESTAEQKRLTAEADFAFRQAFALYPQSPETTFRYVNLLLAVERVDDALHVAATAQTLDPKNPQLETLLSDLSRLKRAQGQ